MEHIPYPHAKPIPQILQLLHTQESGLPLEDSKERLNRFGPNRLPVAKPPTLAQVFFRQFLNPLIYILLFAAIVSLVLNHISDAFFIFGVLLINAIIGTIQEFSAEKSAQSLQQMTALKAYVQRDGENYEINSEELVLGDVVLLESGSKVPADLRLISSQNMHIDESLLTGESLPVAKNSQLIFSEKTPLGDRNNMAFAATMVTQGRSMGVVVGTGIHTELGTIARAVSSGKKTKTPLILRMEKFTTRIAMLLGVVIVLMGSVLMVRGIPFGDVMILSVALAVSAIPEGLPVALTVALAIAAARMAKKNVLVRKLPAVEALGSCTYIATDKTGTLTINQLTAQRLLFPGQKPWEITGTGMVPEGSVIIPPGIEHQSAQNLIEKICWASILCNEGFLGIRDEHWVHHGDTMDVALLVMAHKLGLTKGVLASDLTQISTIPFESERQFAASLYRSNEKDIFSVKGAHERILPMCNKMLTLQGEQAINSELLVRQAEELAQNGYRILAVAEKRKDRDKLENLPSNITPEVFLQEHLSEFTFLGFVGMIDPLRPETKAAIDACRAAGIEVGMITGDYPITALAIAKELGLAQTLEEVVTGPDLKDPKNQERLKELIQRGRVFARVEPQQKLEIVQALKMQNHFVAVTGDGANDAPALKSAHVGVAMGKSGTDVARETSDLIITDDRFASIVSGIKEGRVAYANVRKVIYLLISTGAAEVFLFILSILAGLPLPLTAVQLLWLNLVTNGIQDVALAFEPAEGNEFNKPPRPPKESIFNRLMVQRVIVSGIVVGGTAFFVYWQMLEWGWTHGRAQNSILLLMVLFENIMIGNCRSETRSSLTLNPLRNPLLLFGTIIAQSIHILAMHFPPLGNILGIFPVTFMHWLELFSYALPLFLVVEIEKFLWRKFFMKEKIYPKKLNEPLGQI